MLLYLGYLFFVIFCYFDTTVLSALVKVQRCRKNESSVVNLIFKRKWMLNKSNAICTLKALKGEDVELKIRWTDFLSGKNGTIVKAFNLTPATAKTPATPIPTHTPISTSTPTPTALTTISLNSSG